MRFTPLYDWRRIGANFLATILTVAPDALVVDVDAAAFAFAAASFALASFLASAANLALLEAFLRPMFALADAA